MIKAALNGIRSKADHPGIPITTLELMESARTSVIAGAGAIHFHVRDLEGRETLEADFVDKQVTAIKQILPDIPVGISTGEWIESDISKRTSLIREWTICPDFVSVNGIEDGFELVVNELLKKGVKIEAGISDLQSALRFKKSGLLKHCFRILLEPDEQDFQTALTMLENMESSIADFLKDRSVVLHGFDNTCWDMIRLAKKRGYDSRIGFEDTFRLPGGELAKTNAELVEEAVKSL